MSDVPDLGTLTWFPAAEAPEMLADPVRAVLDSAPAFFVAPIDAALADTAAFCEAYGVSLAASANCVVVAGRRGETTTMAAVMVQASERADVNKAVRKHLDVRKISFAPMDEAVAQTGMEYGGITPVGLPDGWPILIDSGVATAGWVVIGSGLRGSKIAIQGADLAQLPGAHVLSLTINAAG